MAVGGRRRLGLVCLRGLSIYTGFLLGFWRWVEGGYRYKSVPLVLLIYWIGLLCLKIQHKQLNMERQDRKFQQHMGVRILV